MRNEDVLNVIKAAENENRDFLFEHEGKQILSLLGLEVDKSYLVSNENEAISTANQIGYPAVLKIVSPDILHKSIQCSGNYNKRHKAREDQRGN